MLRMSVLKVHMTYQCTAACAHCRFRCSPRPRPVIDHDVACDCIRTLAELNDLELVVLMGGEPGLFPDLTHALTAEIAKLGLRTRIETNGFWGADDDSARAFLAPLYENGASVMLSLDAFHEPFVHPECVLRGIRMSQKLGGDCVLEVAYLDYPNITGHETDVRTARLLADLKDALGSPNGCRTYEGKVFYTGRSCDTLADMVAGGRGVPDEVCDRVPWWSDGELDTLDLLMLDPEGYLSKGCGIAIGNVHNDPVARIISDFDARKHPIFRTLMETGPLGLAREAEQLGYVLKHDYADRCHLCQEARNVLRTRYPEHLAPGQHYVKGQDLS